MKRKVDMPRRRRILAADENHQIIALRRSGCKAAEMPFQTDGLGLVSNP
jgi:hypothetical protein